MAAAVLRLGALPGVDRPALAVQMITDPGRWCCSTSARTRTRPPRTSPVRRMGAIFAEQVLGVARPRVALLSIGEEKGKGDARIQRATELLDATDLHFDGNVEGKDLTTHLADVVVCDAVLGNVVIKFFEGLSTFIFDLWRASSGLAARAGSRTCSCARDRADPARLRLREGRRVAAARRARHGDHHPRPREARMVATPARSRRRSARTRVPELHRERSRPAGHAATRRRRGPPRGTRGALVSGPS
jgi:hypothetical protein